MQRQNEDSIAKQPSKTRTYLDLDLDKSDPPINLFSISLKKFGLFALTAASLSVGHVIYQDLKKWSKNRL